MVSVVAVLDPETPAKNAQPATLVWRRRPGSHTIHGAKPSNSHRLSRVLTTSSPVRTNIGNAVRTNRLDRFQV